MHLGGRIAFAVAAEKEVETVSGRRTHDSRDNNKSAIANMGCKYSSDKMHRIPPGSVKAKICKWGRSGSGIVAAKRE